MDAHSPSRSASARVTPSQLIALGLVAASIGWAVWLLRDRPISEESELLAGTLLPSSELAIMEAAFDRAQLTDYRTDAGKVYVPRGRQSADMRALVDAEALPREFGGSLRRALSTNSPWQSKSLQSEVLRVATQDELSLVLCSMPGIERAAVLYDVEPRAGLEGGVDKTASVSICTQPDVELDPARVQAIRVLVAASIAGLSPERVAVTDLRGGKVFAGPLEDMAHDNHLEPAVAKKLAYERMLTAKLRQSLAFVKGVIVDVAVEFTSAEAVAARVPTPSRQAAAAVNAPAELSSGNGTVDGTPAADAAATARGDVLDSLHVMVSIPDSYFQLVCDAAVARTVAGDRAAGDSGTTHLPDSAATERQEIERLRGLVGQMMPATANAENRQIVVAGYAAMMPAAQGARRTVQPAAAGMAAAASSTQAAPADWPAVLMAAGGEPLLGYPRAFWLAATSLFVGLLAGLMWWLGTRHGAGQESAERQFEPAPVTIDWARFAGDRRGTGIGETDPLSGERRGAA